MAFCEATASQLLKLIMVCMVITLINGDRRDLQDLTSANDVMVRMRPLRRLLTHYWCSIDLLVTKWASTEYGATTKLAPQISVCGCTANDCICINFRDSCCSTAAPATIVAEMIALEDRRDCDFSLTIHL